MSILQVRPFFKFVILAIFLSFFPLVVKGGSPNANKKHNLAYYKYAEKHWESLWKREKKWMRVEAFKRPGIKKYDFKDIVIITTDRRRFFSNHSARIIAIEHISKSKKETVVNLCVFDKSYLDNESIFDTHKAKWSWVKGINECKATLSLLRLSIMRRMLSMNEV